MFVKDDDVVEIKIYYRKKKYQYESLTEKEYEEFKDEEKKKKYEVLTLKLRSLSWQLYNQLQEDAIDYDGDNRRWNIKKYKENKLKKTIKEWSAKNDKGEPVPVNERSIFSLAPPIAESILRAYDEITILGEEEEKN